MNRILIILALSMTAATEPRGGSSTGDPTRLPDAMVKVMERLEWRSEYDYAGKQAAQLYAWLKQPMSDKQRRVLVLCWCRHYEKFDPDLYGELRRLVE